MTRARRSAAVLALSLAFGALGRTADGAAQTSPFPPGEVVERVVSGADTAHAFAVYLPSGYTAGRRWPVLFVLDPRGGAVEALERFRPAAERLGWIVLSSHGSASDREASPNAAALDAMLAAAQERLSVDEQRFYLAGFSGTAREAWTFGLQLQDAVAGVIGFGAALPSDAVLLEVRGARRPPFAFFGGAGTRDFNFAEVQALDETLDAYALPHRVARFPGAHAWPPAEVASEAVEWMELAAVRGGSSPREAGWIDSLLARRIDQAHAAEAAGDVREAGRRWEAVAEDFAGIRETGDARERAAALAGRPEARREADRERRVLAREREALERFWTLTRAWDAAPRPIDARRAARELDLAGWKRDARRTEDEARALSAARVLENVFVWTAFYGPERMLAAGRPEHALALLALAEEVRSGHPHVCRVRARARAAAGMGEEAEGEPACAAGPGAPPPGESLAAAGPRRELPSG